MTTNKSNHLTILLLKDGFSSFDETIRTDHPPQRINIKKGEEVLGALYVKPASPHPPDWASFFESVIDIQGIGENATVAAVLLVESEGKVFAITFGPGRYLLKPDSYMENFGLKVALNSIGKEKIRTLDKTTFDAISRHSKEQASKETDFEDFGIDIEQDLLRAVMGAPKDKAIGRQIYGMDALTVSTDVKVEDIRDLLGRIHNKYLDDSYKKDFPWIDHIGEIKDKAVIEKLDSLMVEKIAADDTEKIWMAVPEIIQWDQVNGFCYSLYSKASMYQDVHLFDFMKSLGETDRKILDREIFDRRRVRCMHVNGFKIHEWKAYKCLYAELNVEEKTYLLNGGKWYKVDTDFVTRVNQAYDEIPEYPAKLPKYKDDSEGKYNERVAKELPEKFALMDRKNIQYGGSQSKVEFCDLYSVDRDIVHVKRYGASSVLSHLFAQGRQSGELFLMEKGFREKVCQELPEGFKIENVDENPRTSDYQVVFAIISDFPGKLEIPFFSKLNLKNSARNLTGLGYRVSKLKIEVDEQRAKLQKVKGRGMRKYSGV